MSDWITPAEQAWFMRDEMYEATPPKSMTDNITNALVSSKQEAKALDPKALAPKKPTIHHVPVALMTACAEALDEGAIKYGRAKWRETETEMMTYLGGCLRHVYAYMEGEDIDPESLTGKSHLAGAVASLAILLDCIAAGTIVDNRPKNIGAAKLLRTPVKK